VRVGRIAVCLPVLLCESLFWLGCTYQAYGGQPLAPSEVAVVKETSRFAFPLGGEGVDITSVDGQHFPSLASAAEVPAGFHYISVHYSLGEAGNPVVGYRSIRDCVIEFEATAEHEYQIEFEANTQRWAAWLRDATTGDRIAECSWTAAPIRTPSPRPPG
jgi:hypothetical protein